MHPGHLRRWMTFRWIALAACGLAAALLVAVGPHWHHEHGQTAAQPVHACPTCRFQAAGGVDAPPPTIHTRVTAPCIVRLGIAATALPSAPVLTRHTSRAPPLV